MWSEAFIVLGSVLIGHELGARSPRSLLRSVTPFLKAAKESLTTATKGSVIRSKSPEELRKEQQKTFEQEFFPEPLE
ncbi:MAG: hypothetical protein QME66_05420 [Candidatus Eisenbacteria bacterium]|nr:hypothetical protein [Candidatus Eisenbacteria bacterium]